MSEDDALNILKTMCTDNFCIEQLKIKQAIETILDLYQQEKEKNKELEKQLKEKEKEVVLVPEGTCFMMKPKNVISKDKIRAKIKELEEKSDYWNCDEIEVLKELLLEE